MRRSPFYSYPSYPVRGGLYADDAYRPIFSSQQRRRPSSHPPSASPAPHKVINIPVFDSVSPPPPPRASQNQQPTVALTVPSIDPVSAATLIQACFRSFSIRKHRPLAQLRTISACRKQLEELKGELENAEFPQKVRSNEKERLRFSESVMAVILRLDAIEGAIPEIRSQRKEATKLAIKLQDAIDGIMSQSEEELGLKSVTMSLPDLEDQTEAASHHEGKAVQAVSSSMQEGGTTSSENDETVQEAAGIVPGPGKSMVEEHGPRMQDVEMERETAIESQENGSDSGETHLLEEQWRHGNSVPLIKVEGMEDSKQGSEDGYAVQGRAEEMNEDVQEGKPVEGMIITELETVKATQEEHEAQDKLVEAMDDIERHDSEHALPSYGPSPTHEPVTQVAGIDSLRIPDERVSGICADESCSQNDNEMGDVVNEDAEIIKCPPAANDSITGKPQDCGGVCQNDQKGTKLGADLSPGAPGAIEDGIDACRLNTADCSPDVGELMDSCGPCSAEQLQETRPKEAILVSGNSVQGLDQVIPTVQARMADGDGGLALSDGQLLKQLSEECGQLKSLLGRLLAQSKAQSKVICALGDRLEMLEQQQLSAQNNQQRGKRKQKKGASRSVKCRNSD